MTSLRTTLALVLITLATASAHPADDPPAAQPKAAEPEATSKADNAWIARVLQRREHKDGGFTVVDSRTISDFFIGVHNQAELQAYRERRTKRLAVTGYDIGPLVDQFLARNIERHRLSLSSDPARGFVVDADGKHLKYFQEDGGEWKQWYKENPKADGITRVSLPAYDEKAGYLLIYVGTQCGDEKGAGYLIVYRVSGGKLEEVKREVMWLS
jgi:hypothetical protein